MNNEDIQLLLKETGYYSGEIDGILGPKSIQSISTRLSITIPGAYVKWKNWSLRRQSIAAAQICLSQIGFDPGSIDGYYGTLTANALTNWKLGSVGKHNFPRQDNLERFYGVAGGPQCTSGRVTPPFPMKIAWDLSQEITKFSCHEKVADSAQRAYDKIGSSYSQEEIAKYGFDLFGGCFNYRKKRGGSSLSTHAYGIAIDTDPIRNQLKWGRDKAFLARPECHSFFEIWESEGWTSLGIMRNYDWMHIQAAGL